LYSSGRGGSRYFSSEVRPLKTELECESHSRTPFRPDPEAFQRSRELYFEPPLDEGIREIVVTLIANGVEAFESCEGGRGHSYAEPTVRFEGDSSEGLRALSIALAHGMPVKELKRAWGVLEKMVHGPWWELIFYPPKDSPQWDDRDTSARYHAEREAHNAY
jgi:hypothetical protein